MAGIKGVLAMSPEALRDLMKNKKELSKTLSELSAAANKRLALFEKSGNTDAFAYAAVMTGSTARGKFKGPRGMTLADQKKEFKRVYQFLTNQTSTPSKWNKFLKETRARIDPQGTWAGFDTVEGRRAYWQAYNRYIERHPSARNDSGRVQKKIRRTFERNKKKARQVEVIDVAIEKDMKGYYEEKKDVEAKATEQSGSKNNFFDIWSGMDDKSKS